MIFSLPGSWQGFTGGPLVSAIRSVLSDGRVRLAKVTALTMVWVAVSAVTVSTGGNGTGYQVPDFARQDATVVPATQFLTSDGMQESSGVLTRASFPAARSDLGNIQDDAIREAVAGMLPSSIWNNNDFDIVVIPVVHPDGSWAITVIVTNNGSIVWAFADVNFFFAALIIGSITGTDNFGQVINPFWCYVFGCFIENFAPAQSFSVVVSGDGAAPGQNACTYESNKNDGGGPVLDSAGDCSFSGPLPGSFAAQHTVEPQFSGTSDVHESYFYSFENTTSGPLNITHWVDITHSQSLSGLDVMGPGTTGCDFTSGETQSGFLCTALVQPNTGFEDNAYDYWYTANGQGNTHAEAWYQEGNNSPVNYYSYDRFYEERADFQLSKSSQGGIPFEGQPYSYTLHLSQTGPSTARNVIVNDDLPEGYTYTGFTGSGTIELTGNQIVWTVPDIPFNRTLEVEYSGSYNEIYPCSVSTRINSAIVIYTNGLDINASDNSAFVETVLCPYSASGSLCDDLNQNNQCDFDEPNVPGPTQLYVDHNGDTFFNASFDQEVVTDINGFFTIPNLGPGLFSLFLGNNQGIQLTSPPFLISFASSDVSGLKIPVTVPPPPVNQGSIHVQKFLDINGDGVKDPDEPGFNGVAITLNGPGGPFVLVTQDMNMDGDPAIDPITERGWVWFENLEPGDYTLSEAVPANMAQTTPPGNSIAINLGPDQRSEGHEFGNQWFDADLGDAPDSFDPERPAFPGGYPTLLANNGAIHLIDDGVRLGINLDAEPDGQPTIPADGDDNSGQDDEDGVFFGDGFALFSLPLGSDPGDLTGVPGTLPGTSVEIRVQPSTDGRLDAWIDFNGDGDWEDVGERIADGLPVSPPFTTFPVAVPEETRIGFTYARFRFSRVGVDSLDGLAPDGEVEDYLLVFVRHFILDSAGDTGDAVPGDGMCDDGAGSCTLRAFIEETNASGDPTALLPGTGKRGAVLLQPQSPYPAITSSIVIAGDGELEIDGSQAGASANGFTILGSGVSILELDIHGFSSTGIRIEGNDHLMARNDIHDNGGDGINIASGDGTSLTENRIYNNGRLGIDLGDDGVTANDIGDADLGANMLQNRPELTLATAETGIIEGLYSSFPDQTYVIEFFSSPVCDASGSGEGEVFLGSAEVTTDGTGTVSFSIVVPNEIAIGESITATATATGEQRDTSEFSACLTAISTSIERNSDAEIPQDFTLGQNYPNPFNPVTTISFGLSRAEFVTIEVFNLLGKRVEVLVTEWKEPGEYTVPFDGGALPSGIYLYRMTAGSFTSSKQLTLLK